MNASVLTAPSAPYGACTEKGYALSACMPASASEDRAFLLSVRSPASERQLVRLRIPMLYAPVFGVDAGDSALLEAVTDALLAALPADGMATASDIDRAVAAAQALGATRA